MYNRKKNIVYRLMLTESYLFICVYNMKKVNNDTANGCKKVFFLIFWDQRFMLFTL